MPTGITESGPLDLATEFPALAHARVALTHDWLTGFGGAERCLQVFAERFPEAPIYTSIYDEARFGATFPASRVRPSFLQRWPRAIPSYRNYLTWMPLAFRRMNLSGFELVLASSHAYSKALTLKPSQKLVCYCYTPIRYLWGALQTEYLATLSPIKRLAFLTQVPDLRLADLLAARRVDRFLAISKEVQGRIKEFYERDSDVLYPPVFTEQWTPVAHPTRESFLIVSRFVPYKKVEIAVAACAKLGLPLQVVGTGPEEAKVRAAAAGSSGISFLGAVDDARLRELYANACALLFTPHEDFGLTPLEANACGTPAMAYAGGGALETVIPGVTGELFDAQTPESLIAVLEQFDQSRYDPAGLRVHAEGFGRPAFERRLCELLESALSV